MRKSFSVCAGKFQTGFLVVLEEGRAVSKGVTITKIYGVKDQGVCEDFSFIGMSRCSKEDVFSQKRGFTLAFKRATDPINSKAVRTELWQEFQKQMGDVK
jgi:hypothetical protein